jgi:hypothetical protein
MYSYATQWQISHVSRVMVWFETTGCPCKEAHGDQVH